MREGGLRLAVVVHAFDLCGAALTHQSHGTMKLKFAMGGAVVIVFGVFWTIFGEVCQSLMRSGSGLVNVWHW